MNTDQLFFIDDVNIKIDFAIKKCEEDIQTMASRGYRSLERNAYSCYIKKEDSGVKDALVEYLVKNGFRVHDHQISYWVGALKISW